MSFHYPRSVRVVGLLTGLVFVGLLGGSGRAWLQGRADAPGWVPLLFLAFLLGSSWLFTWGHGVVALGPEALVVHRWGRRVLSYQDVVRLEQRRVRHELWVHGARGELLRVGKHLDAFPDFYAALLARLPAQVEAAPTLPLEVRVSSRVVFLLWPGGVAGLCSGVTAALVGQRWFGGAVVATSLLALGTTAFLSRRWRFTPDRLEIESWWGPPRCIERVQVERVELQRGYIGEPFVESTRLRVHLRHGSTPLELEELLTDHPLEELHRALVDGWA